MKIKTFCSDSGLKSASKAKNQIPPTPNEKAPYRVWLCAILMLFLISGCAQKSGYEQSQEQARQFIDKHTAGAAGAEKFDPQALAVKPPDLPARFQSTTFLLDDEELEAGFADDITIPIGADISSNAGPVALRMIMKRLAVLKGMNVSWENDVDQGALVDVDIRAEDDFFESIDNLLRQLDYFYEIKGNSIVVKYRQSKVYHLALPYMTPTYEISVGGDVLGGNQSDTAGDLEGTIQLRSKGRDDRVFDVWQNIEQNLAEILSLYEETSRRDTIILAENEMESEDQNLTQESTGQGKDKKKKGESGVAMQRTKSKGALGQVTYDKPLGIITVTAPRGVLERTDQYFENLKKELYRQVVIEAKIVEVELTEDNRTGINWDSLLSNAGFDFSIDFQKLNPLYHNAGIQNRFLTLADKDFTLLLDLIEDQGHTELLANPKITVMNGQPALINVGESLQYVSEVESTVSDNGTVTQTPTTSQVFSGLGLGVIANILGNEVILNLTPIESEITDFTDYTFAGTTLSLPTVAVREMNTQVRVKNGEMLVIGGLISSKNDYEESGIKGLKDLSVMSKAFKQDGTQSTKRELVIMLRPVIQSFNEMEI